MKDEMIEALTGLLRHAPVIPDHFTDTTFVDVPITARSVRRARAMLATLQEKS